MLVFRSVGLRTFLIGSGVWTLFAAGLDVRLLTGWKKYVVLLLRLDDLIDSSPPKLSGRFCRLLALSRSILLLVTGSLATSIDGSKSYA